jgi:hypothetical protein
LKLRVITVSTSYNARYMTPYWFWIDLASAYGLFGFTGWVSGIGIRSSVAMPYSSAEPTSNTRAFVPERRR